MTKEEIQGVSKMTNGELKKEFSRWVDNGKGRVWYRKDGWSLSAVLWKGEGTYVTNDRHAKLRMVQVDKPDTRFEFYDDGKWIEVECPTWNLDIDYRVKVEPVYEYQYMYKVAVGRDKYALTEHREECSLEGYTRVEETKRVVGEKL